MKTVARLRQESWVKHGFIPRKIIANSDIIVTAVLGVLTTGWDICFCFKFKTFN